MKKSITPLNQLQKNATLILLALFALILVGSCSKKENDEETISKEIGFVSTDDNSVKPMQIVELAVSDYTLGSESYSGFIDNYEVTIARISDTTAVFMVPEGIAAGKYNLSCDFASNKLAFTVNESNTISNPQEYVLDYIDDMQVLTGQILASDTLTTLPDELNDAKAEMEEAYAEFLNLSPEDQLIAAKFIDNNRKLLDELNNAIEGYYNGNTLKSTATCDAECLLAQFVKIVAAGALIAESCVAAPMLGSVVAIGFGIEVGLSLITGKGSFLLCTLQQIAKKALNIVVCGPTYLAEIVYEQANQLITNEFKSADITIINEVPVIFTVKPTYRTLNAEDASSSDPVVSNVVSLYSKLYDLWNNNLADKFGTLPFFNDNEEQVSAKELDQFSIQVTDNAENVSVSNITGSVDEFEVVFSTTSPENQLFRFAITYTDPEQDITAETTLSAVLSVSDCNVEDLDGWWSALDDESKKVYNYILGNEKVTDKPRQDELASFCAMEVVDVRDQGFTSFNGLEVFSNVQVIRAEGNSLSSLDVSGLTSLKSLYVNENQLSNLNLSGCTALYWIEATSNNLASLDLSGCTALHTLDLDSNNFTSLDLSACTGLYWFRASGNNLTNLDVSGLTSLSYLYVNENQLSNLNLSGCTALYWIEATSNNLASLDLSACTSLHTLDLDSNNFTSLDLSACTALYWFRASGNNLGSIDLSACTGLYVLNVSDNNLTNLDVSGLTSLSYLHANENQLANLNVSDCSVLTSLEVQYNNLTELDVSGLTSLQELHARENQLANLNVSDCSVLKALEVQFNNLTELDVSGLTSLQVLRANENQLANLDVSGCTALEGIHVFKNNITGLDLSGLTSLAYLMVYENQLANLNLSGCTALYDLDVSHNNLTNIDVSGCTALCWLKVQYNNFTSLDISDFTSLKSLYATNNQLVSLNVAGHDVLENLSVANNNLTSLDFSGCNALKDVDISGNGFSYSVLYELILDLEGRNLWEYRWSCGTLSDSDCRKLREELGLPI